MADTFNKRLSSDDVFNIPYEANKQWDIESSSFESSNIHFQLAQRPSESINKNLYSTESLLYNSILANFYPEYYYTASLDTSSYYQTTNYTASLTSQANVIKGALRLGNQQTKLSFFPTYTSSYVYALNIPKSLYSEKILPTTWEMEISGGKIYDDGEYNLYYTGALQTSSVGTIIGNNSYVGNVFYEQGLSVLTVVPTSIIPPPLPSPPPIKPPVTPPTQEWVALWLYDSTSSSTDSYIVNYNYTVNGAPNSIQFIQTNSSYVGPKGNYTFIVRQDVGSGTWTTITGTPMPQYSKVLLKPGTEKNQPNVYWNIQAGAEEVQVERALGGGSITDYYTYPPPYAPPSLPSTLPVDTEVFGYEVFAMTYKRGAQFSREF